MNYRESKISAVWLFLLIFAAAFCALLLGSGRADAQVNQVIYDGQLENGWQSWSWATTNFSNTTPTYNGADTISVTDPSGYEALWLHPATDFDDSQYVSITFWVNGGSAGGQALNVSGVENENTVTGTVALPVAPVANTWTQETISLAALGATDNANFAGIWVQNATGAPEAAYYVGYADLDSLPGPTTATVNVDASDTLNTIPTQPLGVNTAVWDGYLTDSNTVPLLRAAGVATLRYPGGSASDAYHWAANENENTFYWNSAAAFDPFMQVVSMPMGARTIITANYGSNIANDAGGDPNEAAAWVQYANITQGYGVKYWEIGNEVYGNGYYGDPGWEYDLHYPNYNGERTGQSALGPVTYGQNVVTYANAMKAVDPTIKIGAVLELPGSSDDGLLDWNSNVLEQCGTNIDFVILHWYPEYANDSDSVLLSDTSQIAAFVSGTQALISQYCGVNASKVQILVTETNSDAAPPGKQMLSTVNALFTADDLQTWLEGGVANVDYWDLRNGASDGDDSSLLFGTLQYGDEGILSNASSVTLANGTVATEPPVDTPFPAYYAIQMLRDLGNPGDTMVGSSSNETLVTPHAVVHADGSLGLLLINKDPVDTIATTVNLSNFNPGTSGTSYTYGPSTTTIANGTLATSSSFTVSLPPYTMETVSIPAIPSPPTSLTATAGSAQIVLSWTASALAATYNVYRGTTSGAEAIYQSGLPTAGYTDTGVSPGITYYYEVTAVDPAGESAVSNEASAAVSPEVSSLSVNPATVTSGASSTGTVMLNGPALSAGDVVLLSSSSADATPATSSVTVPAGSNTATFTIAASNSSAAPVTATITAADALGTATAQLTVNPNITVTAMTLNPTTVKGAGVSTGTVTIDDPALAGGTVVALSSSNSACATLPFGNVTVPAGATSATFTIDAADTGTANETSSIAAGLGGATKKATLTVTPIEVTALTVSPATVVTGNTGTGKVTINAPAPAQGAVVTLTSTNSAASIPSSVTVPAGSTTATFTINTSNTGVAPITGSISATAGPTTRSTTLTVNPILAVIGITLNQSAVVTGTKATGTVTLDGPALTGGTVVTITDGAVPADTQSTLKVAAGSTTATFSVATSNTTSAPVVAAISASCGSATVSAKLTVNPDIVVTGLTLSPTSVKAPATSTGTVTINYPALPGGTVVTLSSSNTTNAPLPSSTVTIPAGATSATFAIDTSNTGATTETSTIEASCGGVTKKATLTIKP